MNDAKRYSIIFLSFIAAWVLMIIPISSSILWLRPEWITLILIYWAFREPDIVGVGLAWSIGLMMDVLNGSLLGQYALCMSIVVSLAQLFKHRMRVFPPWHQAIVILILVGFEKLSLLIVQWLLGHPPASMVYWLSAVTSMFMWPFILQLMKFYGRKTL